MTNADLNSNVFHVMKFIPYKRRNARIDSSDSSSKSEANNSDFMDETNISEIRLISSASSSTDSELDHISTPSEKSSISSRENLDMNMEQNQKNQQKMKKKVRFPKRSLYLDDTQLG